MEDVYACESPRRCLITDKKSKGYAWFPKENESEIWRMKLYNGDKDRFID